MSEELRRAGTLFGGIGKAISIASALANLAKHFPDISKATAILSQWAAIEDPPTTAAGLKARIGLICDLADIAATQTATAADDAVVAQLRALAANDAMLDFAASILARFFAQVPTATPAAFHEFLKQPDVAQSLAEVTHENQFDIASLMKIFDLIMQLIAIVRSMAPAATPAPADHTTPAVQPGNPFGF